MHPSNVLYLYQWRKYSQSMLFVSRVIEEINWRHTIINNINYTNTNESIAIVIFHMIASHQLGNFSLNFWGLLMFGSWIPWRNIICLLFIRNQWFFLLECKSLQTKEINITTHRFFFLFVDALTIFRVELEAFNILISWNNVNCYFSKSNTIKCYIQLSFVYLSGL